MGLNVRVFLEIQIGTKTGGRVVFELFNDVVSRTVHNFLALCTGEYGKAKRSRLPLCYKGCSIFKVVPGLMIQSGDFEKNNGTGGESVFGDGFPMESMLRRHCQAGVLSMTSDDTGRIGSQFLVTLRRAPQLDGKCVVIGQVVEGMDILRAIEKCPIDANNCPRVPIIIVDCGIQKRLQGMRSNDPRREMREAVHLLMSSLKTDAKQAEPKKMSEAQRGLLKLQQVLAQSTHDSLEKNETTTFESIPHATLDSEKISCHVSAPSRESPSTETPTNSLFSDSVVVREKEQETKQDKPELHLEQETTSACPNERENKLYYLRQRLAEGRHLNSKEVALENTQQHHKKSFPVMLEQKKVIREILQATQHKEPLQDDNLDPSSTKTNDDSPSLFFNKTQKGQWSTDEAAYLIQWKDDIIKKKQANAAKAFGWDAINADASFRAHKKRTLGLTLQPEAYAKQMLELGENFYDPTATLVSSHFIPTEEAKNRLATALEKDKAKRKAFSRRRKYVEAETVAYVNDFNRSFNQKLERAYGAYSAEIRHNLERGTAL